MGSEVNVVSLNCPTLQILSKTETLVFPTSNCHNSRTSDDIDMKFGPVTNLDKINKATSNKSDDGTILVSCDVFVIFPIYRQLGAIWKTDSGRMICKTYIFINGNILSYKNWKQK